jgi:hypothetical protein
MPNKSAQWAPVAFTDWQQQTGVQQEYYLVSHACLLDTQPLLLYKEIHDLGKVPLHRQPGKPKQEVLV